MYASISTATERWPETQLMREVLNKLENRFEWLLNGYLHAFIAVLCLIIRRPENEIRLAHCYELTSQIRGRKQAEGN